MNVLDLIRQSIDSTDNPLLKSDLREVLDAVAELVSADQALDRAYASHAGNAVVIGTAERIRQKAMRRFT